MTTKLIFVIPVAALIGGCGAKEKEMLQTKVDSLNAGVRNEPEDGGNVNRSRDHDGFN